MISLTRKQKIQRALSWKLKVVLGAAGSIYPTEIELSPRVRTKLYAIYDQPRQVENMLREELKDIK